MKKTTLGFLFFITVSTTLAQSVSGYAFAESTETYTAVTGIASTATGDDGTENAIEFGFDFPFGGVNYSTFSISVNGFVRLGNEVAGQNWINALGTTAAQRPLIAPFWDDHNQGAGSVTYTYSGTHPNRFVQIGWNNINPSGAGETSETAFGSFKIRLHETTGVIEFVYGPTINAVNAFTASIGLNDDTTFLSVSPGTQATVSSASANNEVTTSANLVGKKYTFTPQPLCSGSPTPGNTVSSLTSACAGVNFTLSFQNPSSTYGITYQWQSSTDGETFTNIDFANSSTFLTTQFQTTYYQCLVSCSGQTATSMPIQVEMNAPAECYCTPVYTFGMTDGDLISNVSITGTTLSNNTGTTPANPSYTYFFGEPNYTAELQVGGAYQLNVTVGTYGQQHSTAWIDYNDDAFFTDEERIGFSEGEVGALETAAYTIVLSCDAAPGIHRLRIRDVWNTDSSGIDSCAEYGYGETEDYDVSIVAGAACAPPSNLVVSSVNPTSGLFSWNAGCGQTSWNIYVGPAGAGTPTMPTHTNVSSPFVFTNLEPEGAYEIYVQGNCGTSGTSDWAGPIAFTTPALAVANDDCSSAFSTQVGGTFEQYAITATNVGATKSLGEPNVTCAAFNFGGDVWFSAVVPESGNLSFETRADPTSMLNDTGLSAYSGSCGALTALGCSDDEGVEGFSVLHLTGLAPGATIFARVWEYANDNPGTFRFSAYETSLHVISTNSNSLRFYPNPVNDVLVLSYDGSITSVAISNLLGQRVLRTEANTAELSLSLSDLSAGTYLIKVTTNDGSKTLKIVKE